MPEMNQMTTTLRYNNITHSSFMDKIAIEFPNIQPLSGFHDRSGDSGYMIIGFEASPLEVLRASELRHLIPTLAYQANIEILNKYHIQVYDMEITQASILLILNNVIIYK